MLARLSYNLYKAEMLKFNEIKNFFIILFAYCIQNYAKLKINRVIIPVSLENSQETANLK